MHILDATDPDALPRLVRPRKTGIEYYVEHHYGTFYILTNLPDGENYQVSVPSTFSIPFTVLLIEKFTVDNFLQPHFIRSPGSLSLTAVLRY